MTITEKIIHKHLISGTPRKGERIVLKIDQTLTQDATGTMAYLQFEALGTPRVRTELSVSYVDHNTLQQGFENADDHRYLQTVAAKYGILFSRPWKWYLPPGSSGAVRGSRKKHYSAPTPTPQPAVESGCLLLEPGDWTWPWLWEVLAFIWLCQRL